MYHKYLNPSGTFDHLTSCIHGYEAVKGEKSFKRYKISEGYKLYPNPTTYT